MPTRRPRLAPAIAVLAATSAAMLVGLAGAPGQPQRAAAESRATRADLVRLPFPRDDGTLTPTTFERGYSLMTLVYDTLMWRDASGTPQPWLARSMRKSNGGRQITLRLRNRVRWHDGRPLTASDVAFTFAFFLARPHPRFTPQLVNVERVRAVDPLTVTITLREPAPGFDEQPLADLPILPRHLWEDLPPGKLAPAGLPVGSGPYRLVEHQPGRRYRFRANPRYFLGRPRVDNIAVPIVRDFDRTVRDLENRRIDMIPVPLPRQTVERLQGSGIGFAEGRLYSGTVLMFDTGKPPFDQVAARRAVARAIDLDRIVSVLGRESAVAADRGYVAPGSPAATTASLHRFDKDAAREALRRLGLPKIRVLASDSDPQRKEVGRQVVLTLERAGARAELVELSRTRLGRAVGEDGSTPDFEAAIWDTPPLASYGPEYLRVVFGADPRLATLNYSRYRSETFDHLAARAARELNPETRVRLVRDEIKRLAEDLPVVPLVYPEAAFAYRPAIYDGWRFVGGSGILDKRSFLPRSGLPADRPLGQAPAPESPAGGLGPAGYVALALLAVTLAVAAAGLVGSARRRTRH